MRYFAIAAVVATAGLLGAQEPKDTNQVDLEALQGAWRPIKAMRGGKEMDKDLKNVTVTFSKDMISIAEGPGKAEKAGFKLDAKQNPKHIDISPPEKGDEKVAGIYKIDKDELTLVFGRPGKARPKKFDDPEMMVIVLKKQKK